MFRTILVPLDGSPFAEHALPWALSIARRANASLRVATVHVPVVYVNEMMVMADKLDREMKEQARGYLDQVVKRIEKASSVPVKGTLLEGPITDSLQEHALATGADLIVSTTHGRGPFTRFWLGSVADELLRRSPLPLLLIRPHDGAADLTGDKVVQHLLVPLDGGETAERIIGPALALGRLMNADYRLFRVVPPVRIIGYEPDGFAFDEPALNEQLVTEARRYLDNVAERLRKESLQATTHVVLDPQPAAAILEEAKMPGIDGIALETHGRRGLPRLLLGSVADKVVRGASVPVLVHRPPKS